jgi:hypothetical protein
MGEIGGNGSPGTGGGGTGGNGGGGSDRRLGGTPILPPAGVAVVRRWHRRRQWRHHFLVGLLAAVGISQVPAASGARQPQRERDRSSRLDLRDHLLRRER